jgi:hypothetical protein
MTLINALINYSPSKEARKELRDLLNIYDTVAVLSLSLSLSLFLCLSCTVCCVSCDQSCGSL